MLAARAPKAAAHSLSQLGAVVLGDPVRRGCRDVLEFGIPEERNRFQAESNKLTETKQESKNVNTRRHGNDVCSR